MLATGLLLHLAVRSGISCTTITASCAFIDGRHVRVRSVRHAARRLVSADRGARIG
jgi:hypothetical protein